MPSIIELTYRDGSTRYLRRGKGHPMRESATVYADSEHAERDLALALKHGSASTGRVVPRDGEPPAETGEPDSPE